MEEGHVVEPKGLGDGGIVLVARAADRIEALAARLQPAREPVHLPAGALAVEELGHGFAPEPDRFRLDVGRAPRQLPAAQVGD